MTDIYKKRKCKTRIPSGNGAQNSKIHQSTIKIKTSASRKPAKRIFTDSDIDPNDIQAQIKRCKERIVQNISPSAYRRTLAALRRGLKRRKKMMEDTPGLNWETVQRLDALTTIENILVKKGDPCKELLNVRAIMVAYRSQALVFDGQATYWGGGKLLEGPKAFSWDDFRRLNTEENRCGGGFWVEGVFGPTPQSIKHTYKSAPAFKEGFELDHVVRFRSEGAHNETNAPEFEMRFVDDTGADTMMIFRDDVQRLMGNNATKDDWPWDHMMGFDLVVPSGLQKFAVLVIAVEVNMYNKRPEELGERILMRDSWTIVRCDVMFEHDSVDQNGRRRERLNGPWLRSSLFTATAPTDRKRLFVSTNKKELWAKSMLPAVNSADALPPAFMRPRWGIAHELDPATDRYRPVPDESRKGDVPQ